jgi:hypothetical protein
MQPSAGDDRMPAIDRSLTPGYRLNAQTIHRDLYRLAAILLSYMALEKSGDRLLNLRDQFVDDELSHLIAQTANANRLQPEHMQRLRTDPSEKSFEPVEGYCGEWDWPTDPWKAAKPLSFKDACDKIIHAQEVGMICFDPPSLFLSGQQSGKKWEVKVDLLPYIELSAKNFDDAIT